MDRRRTALAEAAGWLREARQVVVFSGAGISAESGIPTFRDDDGFWQRFPPEEFATWRGILRAATLKPSRLADFLHNVLGPIAAAGPNAGHRAVAEMEKHARVTVITQNVDNLHQEAGSTTVWEIHGSLFEIVTRKGRFVRLLSRSDMGRIAERLDRARHSRLALPRTLRAMRPLAGLSLGGFYRPNVVLFGDAMAEPAWTLGRAAIRTCDVFLQVGTSGVVWPAAMLPHDAKAHGATIITVDPTEGVGDIFLKGTAAAVLPLLLDEAFGE